jgi:hypothetical protein
VVRSGSISPYHKIGSTRDILVGSVVVVCLSCLCFGLLGGVLDAAAHVVVVVSDLMHIRFQASVTARSVAQEGWGC